MNASELRIGNLVDFRGQIETVYQIRYSGVDFFRGTTKKGIVIQSYVWEEVKPITLTEEWLLKFGFEFGMKFQDFVKGQYKFTELKNKNLYGEFSEEGIFYFSTKTKIKYVHQLQNLYFALTGEEL